MKKVTRIALCPRRLSGDQEVAELPRKRRTGPRPHAGRSRPRRAGDDPPHRRAAAAGPRAGRALPRRVRFHHDGRAMKMCSQVVHPQTLTDTHADGCCGFCPLGAVATTRPICCSLALSGPAVKTKTRFCGHEVRLRGLGFCKKQRPSLHGLAHLTTIAALTWQCEKSVLGILLIQLDIGSRIAVLHLTGSRDHDCESANA